MTFRKNKLAIGKRVYETGEHIDKNSIHAMNAESKYHLAYMTLVLKLDKEECYQKWLELDDKIITPLTRSEFENFYEKSFKVKFDDSVKMIKITQSDFDYINGLNVSLGAKETGLLLLAYCYSISKWEFETVYGETIPRLSKSADHNLTADFNVAYAAKAKELLEAGMIEIIPGKKVWDRREGEYKENPDTNKIVKPQHKGKILIETDMLFDITSLFWMFRVKKCSCCGKEFEMSNKCQTDLCEECYGNKVKKNDINRKRVIRSFIGDKIRICEDCGKEFKCTGKCQRTKCGECYKIYRRKCKTLTMQKLRK